MKDNVLKKTILGFMEKKTGHGRRQTGFFLGSSVWKIQR